jgi:hypothetical protein
MEQMIGISLAEYIQNKLKQRETINYNDNFILKEVNINDVNDDPQANNIKDEAQKY